MSNIYKKVIFVFFSMASFAYGAAVIDVSTTGHKSDHIIIERPTKIGKDSLFYKGA